MADALTGAPEMPTLPAFSHFLENTTHDMQRDAIRAYARAHGQAMAEHARRVALEDAANLCDDRSTIEGIAQDCRDAIRAAAQQKGSS